MLSGWPDHCNTFILKFLSDAATANIKMFESGAIRELEDRALLLHKHCDMSLELCSAGEI